MRGIKSDTPVEPEGILIKPGPGEGALKEAFSLAARLHEAGHTAEVHLGGAEPGGIKWLVEAGKQGRGFVLTDKVKKVKAETGTVDELLKKLKT